MRTCGKRGWQDHQKPATESNNPQPQRRQKSCHCSGQRSRTKNQIHYCKNFPLHGIIGEEFSSQRQSNYTWIGDAIDGTWSYLNGEKLLPRASPYVSNDMPRGMLLSLFTIRSPMKCTQRVKDFSQKSTTSAKTRQKTSQEKQLSTFRLPEASRVILQLYELWRIKIDKLISTGGSISYNFAKLLKCAEQLYSQRENPLELWDSRRHVSCQKLGKSNNGCRKDFEQKNPAR